MGRPFNPRENYDDEVLVLKRMISMLSQDKARNPEWRRQIIHHLREAFKLMLNDTVIGMEVENVEIAEKSTVVKKR